MLPLAIALLALATTSVIQTPTVSYGVPPEVLWPDDHVEIAMLVQSPEIRAAVRVDVEGRHVELLWTYSPEGPEGAGVQQKTLFATPYWPCRVLVAGPSTLYVSGKLRGGATTIEKWTFGSAIGSTGVTPTGTSYGLAIGERTTVDLIYSEATVGRDLVEAMFQRKGTNEPSLLVQFYDSHALYQLNESTGAVTLVGTPATIPALALPHNRFWQRNHVTYGYCYFLGNGGSAALSQAADQFVLFDQNRDGTIDGNMHISDSVWAQSFNAPTNYLP